MTGVPYHTYLLRVEGGGELSDRFRVRRHRAQEDEKRKDEARATSTRKHEATVTSHHRATERVCLNHLTYLNKYYLRKVSNGGS